jgi:hypothetical protein
VWVHIVLLLVVWAVSAGYFNFNSRYGNIKIHISVMYLVADRSILLTGDLLFVRFEVLRVVLKV